MSDLPSNLAVKQWEPHTDLGKAYGKGIQSLFCC